MVTSIINHYVRKESKLYSIDLTLCSYISAYFESDSFTSVGLTTSAYNSALHTCILRLSLIYVLKSLHRARRKGYSNKKKFHIIPDTTLSLVETWRYSV